MKLRHLELLGSNLHSARVRTIFHNQFHHNLSLYILYTFIFFLSFFFWRHREHQCHYEIFLVLPSFFFYFINSRLVTASLIISLRCLMPARNTHEKWKEVKLSSHSGKPKKYMYIYIFVFTFLRRITWKKNLRSVVRDIPSSFCVSLCSFT